LHSIDNHSIAVFYYEYYNFEHFCACHLVSLSSCGLVGLSYLVHDQLVRFYTYIVGLVTCRLVRLV
jgi:hypothetical protein